MIETKEVLVVDRTYHITLFPARAGLTYLNKLKSIVGPAFGKAFTGDADEGEVEVDSISNAIESLITKMDEHNFEEMVVKAITGSVTNEQRMELVFDSEFHGRYDLILGLMKEILVLNYGTLFLGHGDSDSPLKNLMANLGQ